MVSSIHPYPEETRAGRQTQRLFYNVAGQNGQRWRDGREFWMIESSDKFFEACWFIDGHQIVTIVKHRST